MHRCTVKWFNDSKGYGVATDEYGTEIFVHYTTIKTDGFKTLSEGQLVDIEYSNETHPVIGKYRATATKIFKV